MSNNKQSSVDFYRIESQKLMIKAIHKEITEKEWRLLENKLGEQAKAMHKQEIIAAKDDNYVYGEAWGKLGTLGEQYYNETFLTNNEFKGNITE